MIGELGKSTGILPSPVKVAIFEDLQSIPPLIHGFPLIGFANILSVSGVS
jgi:hypothetical protein